ncbi:MAG: MoxR family ATPase, partial [Proteobacteria bacterium]|nr:MoxR family ATPase [Pseudomonadota bacterium]
MELPKTVEATLDLLAAKNYVADRSLATALLLSLK